MKVYLLEIKRFLKKYLKIIIIGASVLAIFFTAFLFFINNRTQEETEPEIEESPVVFENDSKIAYFRFYIKVPDGTTFTNSSTVHQLFNLDSVRKEVRENTGINVKQIEQDVKAEGVHTDFNPVRVTVDSNSSIFTALFETGNSRNNLKLAEYYHQKLVNKDFNILESNSIYTIVKPQLVEEPELVSSEKPKPKETVNKLLIVDNIINLVIGFILGSVLFIGIVLIRELYGKKLAYAFGYDNGVEDNFMILDNQLNNIELIRHFLATPFTDEKLVVSENPINTSIKNNIVGDSKILTFSNSNNNSKVFLNEKSSILEIELPSEYQDVIIIVETNVTDRKWYNEQLRLSKLHSLDVKILQINI